MHQKSLRCQLAVKNNLSLIERMLSRNDKISVLAPAPPFMSYEIWVSSFLNLGVGLHGIYSNFQVSECMLLTVTSCEDFHCQFRAFYPRKEFIVTWSN